MMRIRMRVMVIKRSEECGFKKYLVSVQNVLKDWLKLGGSEEIIGIYFLSFVIGN